MSGQHQRRDDDDDDPEDAPFWELAVSSKNNLGARRELWSRQATSRSCIAVMWLGALVLSFVGEQFVWATNDGSRIGLKWAQTSASWALLFTTCYAQFAAFVALQARTMKDDGALKEYLLIVRFLRVMINPLGLVGFLAWFFFARHIESAEDFRSDDGRALWSVITIIKHVGPESLILLDIFYRPKPILRLPKLDKGTLKNTEFFAVYILPIAYFTFLCTYILLGGTNYKGQNFIYVDSWSQRIAAFFGLGVILFPCHFAHFAFTVSGRNFYKDVPTTDI